MAEIHATALVDSKARLAAGARIGPYCVIGPDVEIGEDAELLSHVVVAGHTRVGARTRIFPFASVGHPPQDLKFAGERTELVIGEDNVIREHVTMNPGTVGGGGLTSVGNGCLFMVGSHVAHDCHIGSNVVMANNATLGGHVTVSDRAIIGGLAAVHQFVRIGRQAMIGGMTGVEHDIIPYGLAFGDRARLHGLNVVGLKRSGFGRQEIQTLTKAYRLLFADRDTLAERVEQVAQEFGAARGVADLLDFVRGESSRALCRPVQDDGA